MATNHMPDDRTNKNILLSRITIIVISVMVCCLSIIGGELDYAGNDDTFRNLVSVGAFGNKFSSYIPFSNILYGAPIALLNTLLPTINWYYWIMILVSLLSVILVCFILFEKYSLAISFLGTLIINIALARDYYIAVQFTKVASLWIATGIMLVLISLFQSNKGTIIGYCLFAIGAACRNDCVYMMIPFIGVWGLFFLLSNRSSIHKSIIQKLIQRCVVLVAILLILFASEKTFRILNPDWNEFWIYNRASAHLTDHMGVSYENDPVEYQKINTDSNDLHLYSSWEFGDTDFYTIDWLYKVIEIESKHAANKLRISPAILANSFKNMLNAYSRAADLSVLILVLAYSLLLVLIIQGRLYGRLLALGNLFCLYVIYWYFTCVNRFMWRVEAGAYVAMVIFMGSYICTFIIDKNFKLPHKRILGSLTLIGIAIFILYSGYQMKNWRYVKDKEIVAHEADITGRLYSFNNNADNFYVLTDFYVTNNPMRITKEKYSEIYKNSVYLGNWIIPSPAGLYFAQVHGIDNPMRALVEKENVLLHANDSDLVDSIARHLTKVLNREIDVEQIEDEIWRFQ